MNDIRRSILWAIFCFSMVLLWDKWQIYNGKPATFFPSVSATKTSATATSQPGVAPSAAVAAGEIASAGVGADAAATTYEVSTDVLKMRFSSRGARLVYAELLKYADANEAGKNAVLLDDRQSYAYLLQTGLTGGLPDHTTPMQLVGGETSLADGKDSLVLRFESEAKGNVKYAVTWTFGRGRYDAKVSHEVMNVGTEAVNAQLYLRILRDSNKPVGESSFYFTFTGPVVYTEEEKYQKFVFSDIDKNKASFIKQAPDGYIAMVQHYFVSSWILPKGQERQFQASKVSDNLYSVAMLTNFGSLAAGEKKVIESTSYVGPQLEKNLEVISPGLELVKDYGWLTILSKPLYWLLYELHKLIANWGWSIVALVVLLKAALYWFNAKAYASMARMKAVNPKIAEMRERLKDNPQQMQQEMMRIYRDEKVNPMGGCLPMVVQIPIFIALYWVLLSSVEMRGAPWVLWIKDLAQPDPFFILPVIMTATTLVQTWLNPTPPDPVQAKMMWIMPLVFSVMFFFFPAGLVLYWITNNVLTIAQQWFINKRLGVLK